MILNMGHEFNRLINGLLPQASYNRISDMAQCDNHPNQSPESESTETHKEVELANQSCKQKLIVVIAADEQSATKHLVVSEACPSAECRGSIICRKEAGHHPANPLKRSRFPWIDRNVLMASLCYSMTGLIFIITGEQ